MAKLRTNKPSWLNEKRAEQVAQSVSVVKNYFRTLRDENNDRRKITVYNLLDEIEKIQTLQIETKALLDILIEKYVELDHRTKHLE